MASIIMADDQLSKYYDYLKKAGADVAPTMESFQKTLSNPDNAQKYYGYLKDNGFDTAPSFESFQKTFGLVPTIQGMRTSIGTEPQPKPQRLSDFLPKYENRSRGDIANLPGAKALPQTDEQLQKHFEDQRQAYTNTAKSRLKAKNLPDTPQNIQKEENTLRQMAQSGDIVLSRDDKDNPIYARVPSWQESFVNGLLGKVNQWQEAADQHAAQNDNKKLSNVLEEQTNTPTPDFKIGLADLAKFAVNPAGAIQHVVENSQDGMKSTSPTIGGNLAHMIGGLTPYFAMGALSSTIPIATESVFSGTGEKMKELYKQAKEQLLQQGYSEENAREKAAEMAKNNSGLAALPGAILNTALMGGPTNPVMAPAAKTFKEALSKMTFNSAKMGLYGGAAEGATQAIQGAQGYDVKDAWNKVMDAAGQWGLTTLALEGLGQLPNMPGYLRAAWKEYARQPELKPLVDEAIDKLPNGNEVRKSLNDYESARQKVDGIVPDEHISSYAGILEKQDKIKDQINELESRKASVPEVLHTNIDDQIKDLKDQSAGLDKQLASFKKSANPLDEEVDDMTGQKLGKEDVSRETVSEGNISKPIELNPEDTSQSPLNTEQNATTISEKQHQESNQQSGVSEHPRTEGERNQATQSEANNRNSGISGETKKINDLFDKVDHYDNLAKGEGKNSAEGAKMLAEIKNDAKELGLKYDEKSGKLKKGRTTVERSVEEGPFQEQHITDWLNEESKLTPEQEQVLTDNIDNLIQEHGSEHKGEPAKEVEQPAAISQEPNSEPPQPNDENITAETNQTEPAPTESSSSESRTVGVSHESLNSIADRLGLKPVEPGKGLSTQEMAERGRVLLENGADPYHLNNVSDKLHDKISVARAYTEQLFKEMDAITDKNSDEYNVAVEKLDNYIRDTAKVLGTEARNAFQSLQGERDIDTDSFTAVSRQVKERVNGKMTPEQEESIKRQTEQIAGLKLKIKELEDRIAKENDKHLEESKPPKEKGKFQQKAEKLAEVVRKLKTDPFTFKDENGNEIPVNIQGLSWNDLVELGAKTIEKTGKLADAVASMIDKVKDADWYKKLSDNDKSRFEQQLSEHLGQVNLLRLQDMFKEKEGNKFDHEEASALWKYAKDKYISKGVSFTDTIGFLSDDLGLSMKQVYNAIVTPKTKRLADEVWKANYDLSRSRNGIKRFVQEQGASPILKNFQKATNLFREAAVFGHGGIFVGTHAMPTLFDLPRSKYAVKALLNAYKLAYGKARNYELMMGDLKNSPNYVIAQRAGLQNNPDVINSDAEIKSNTIKWMSEAGQRGFNAIKILRQNLFDAHYNRLTEAEQNDPNVAKSIAQLINNATGATNAKIPNWVKDVTFAGGMEVSRWEKLTKNPLKATNIAIKAITNPKDVTPAEAVFAKVWAKRVGNIAATYMGMLAINNALQTYNHKPAINFTDPTKADWLRLKVGDFVVDPTSGMLSAMTFGARLIHLATESHKQFVKERPYDRNPERLTELGKLTSKYAISKLSPFYSTLAENVTRHDYSGNTLPYSEDKPYSRFNHKLTWSEYLWSKAPLPVAEAARTYYESTKEAGMTDDSKKALFKAIGIGAISGGTGARVYEKSESKAAKQPKTVEQRKQDRLDNIERRKAIIEKRKQVSE